MKQIALAINCPKGGVGKSTLSKELAVAYSLSEINGNKVSVCVIDANIDFGDISAMLKVPPSLSMLEWAKDIQQNGDKDYTFEEIAPYLIQTPTGIYILPASSKSQQNNIVTYQTMKTMIRNIRKFFDVVIMDTGNNTFDFTIACFEQSTQIMVVVTDETTSINCALSLFKTFEKIGISMDKVEIVLNKYPVNKSDRCFKKEEIEEVVGSIFSVVSMDENMPQINSSGVPAMLGKDTPFKRDVAHLAKKFLPDINEKAILKAK